MTEKLEIVLDDIAIADLTQLIAAFRHADALALTAFLNRRVRRIERAAAYERMGPRSVEEVGGSE